MASGEQFLRLDGLFGSIFGCPKLNCCPRVGVLTKGLYSFPKGCIWVDLENFGYHKNGNISNWEFLVLSDHMLDKLEIMNLQMKSMVPF